MDAKHLKPAADYWEQLALELFVEEETQDEDAKSWVPPEVAHLRSETARQLLEGKKSNRPAGFDGDWPPPWMETYHMLRSARWSWRVACYVAWAASPKLKRWPRTQDELASEVLGLTSDRVIAKWRKKNPAIDEAVAVLQAAPLMAHRADILLALAVSASDPDHRHNPDRKLALEMTGDYIPKAKIDLRRGDQVEDLSQLSDEELDVLAKRVLKSDKSEPDLETDEE